MPLPNNFLAHLRLSGYHPRSNKHSNFLAVAIVDDLIATCEQIAFRASQGQLVYQLNFDLIYATAYWNVDLVLGPPPPGTPPPTAGTIIRTNPSTIHIAIEIKSVMTEHRKAVKNRKRDFEAHHEHVHNYNPQTIAGGVMVVNVAANFQSPLRLGTTLHGKAVAQHCVDEMRKVSVRAGPSGYGLDAKTVILVDMDNVAWPTTKYYEERPAPQVGDPMHYDAFIQRLCSEHTARW